MFFRSRMRQSDPIHYSFVGFEVRMGTHKTTGGKMLATIHPYFINLTIF